MAKSGTPLPWPVREKIKALILAGATYRCIAAELGVSTRTVVKYSRQKCTTDHKQQSCT